MHGCSLGSILLVNAEVDSMGGVVDGGVGTGIRTSPRRVAIEKAQAELRLEYDVREERRRELEFLEKGGNPLDFKFVSAASISVQSTSLADQPPEQFVPSEAKGSFALTASPRGDSVESSGRLGAPTVNEPNSADNLLLFDGESEFTESKKHPVHPLRNNIAPPSEQSSQLDGSQNAKGSGESTAFGLPKSRAYKRRNRSRPNRDGARSSSTDLLPSQGGHLSSLPRHGPKYAKATLDAERKKDQNVSSNCSPKPASADDGIGLKVVSAEGRVDTVLDNVKATESSTSAEKVVPSATPTDINDSISLQDNQHDQNSQVDVQKTPAPSLQETELVSGRQRLVSLSTQYSPRVAISKTENQTDFSQLNGFSNPEGGRVNAPSEVQNSSAACSTKVLDSESSCSQTTRSLDRSNNGDQPNTVKDSDSNGNANERTLLSSEKPDREGEEMLKEKSESKDDGSGGLEDDVLKCVHENRQTNGSIARPEGELHGNISGSQNEMMCSSSTEGLQVDSSAAIVMEKKSGNSLANDMIPDKEKDGINTTSVTESAPDNADPPKEEEACNANQNSVDPPTHKVGALPSVKGSIDGTEKQSSDLLLKSANKEHEDSILEEARIIEAKRKRIAELSIGVLRSENHQKSHWSFVLEEMAWLANDFAQERRWKTTIAAQVSHQIARTCQVRFEQQNLRWMQKKVASSLVKAVVEFWNAAEKASKVKVQCAGDDSEQSVKGYAVRFLKDNTPLSLASLAEAPGTPDRISDFGIQEVSWDDHLTEEDLFYTVTPGAMETYRKSIESHVARVEKFGNSIQEEGDISMYDAAADNGYEEDEGETSTYYISGGFEGNRQSKFAQKKRNGRSSEQGTDSPFMHSMENKFGAQQSSLMGKRPANTLNVGSIPTKRMRTAPRQRFQSPFTAGTSGGIHGPNKTETSSGDTNSFQDDQSTMHGGSHLPNGFEVDSVRDSEKQLPFDSTEVSKPKKRRKPKHLGSAYEQRWQLDNNFQNEQRDHSRKRLDGHQLESNGSSGLFNQHVSKKPKLMRQSLDNSYDNLAPMSGSVPSPVASQMSNMSHSNKLIKIFSGRDRGRKPKSLKIPVGQTGSGSGWSHFEDQALVVLVHDMGPNWELISDALNSTLQLKFIFRKPKECKDRHKVLMEMSAGDGADSAEDSGSSQPYQTTLPGIPKGSARQLFQRLQGPKEEEAIKSHFEKIIMISQKQHSRRIQNDGQDRKPVQPHNSHAIALAQHCPNNLDGHPFTPLDLCDSTSPSPDLLQLGFQASHGSGIGTSNQGSAASMLPASGSNSSLQGSSGLVLGNNFPSPAGPTNASPRDSRYGVPRAASLAIDEPQRMQQYNHVFSGRNIQQFGLAAPGAPPGTDRGRMLSGGNGMGMMGGMNRGMPMARPGFQGLPPPSMLNSGSMVAMPSSTNMHSGVGPGQGSAMVRPRDIGRPGQNPEHQRQMMAPELQMQATQGNSQGGPPYGGMSSGFPSQTSPPPVPTYPLHQQISPQQSHILTNPHHPHIQGPNHVPNSQQQAHAMRYAKQQQQQRDRVLQQQQHHQQFAASNALMPQVPPQAQLPASSSLQNTSQVQPQSSTPTQPSPMSPMSQHKLHMPPHGISRNPQTSGGGLTNQMGKQRQRPLQQHSFQQSGRHHPHPRQQSQQQQTKHIKGAGRGNMLMHQNLTTEPSLLNGISPTPVGQTAEKPEHVMHLMQGQGLHPGSSLNTAQPSKPLQAPHSSNQFHAQQKAYSGPPISSSKQVQLPSSHTDNSNQGNAAPSTCGQKSLPPSHHQQSHHKLANQGQSTVQRLLKQNHHMNAADQSNKLLADQAQDDHQAASNSSPMGTTAAMPQSTVDTTTATSAASFSAAGQRKVPEHVQNSGMPNPVGQLAPSESSIMPTTDGQGQSSDGSPSLGHNGGAQWQQQQSQVQPPPLSSSTVQQQEQQSMPQQMSLQSEQQTHVEAGNSNLYQTH